MAQEYDAQVKITAEVEGLKSGINTAKESIASLGTSTSGIASSISGVNNNVVGLTSSFGNLGSSVLKIGGFTTLMAGVYQLTSALKDAIITGIKYNATLESMRIGIASIIAVSSQNVDSTGKAITATQKFALAQKEADEAIRLLKQANLETSATLEQITSGFQATLAPARAAGLTIGETIEYTKLMTQAAGAMGMNLQQLPQELKSVIAGTIDMNSTVATNLGITNEQIKKHKEQGDLFVFLKSKLQDFATAGDEVSKSFSGSMSNMEDNFNEFSGLITEPIFDVLKVGISEMSEQFKIWAKDLKDSGEEYRTLVINISAYSEKIAQVLNVLWESLENTVQMLIAMIGIAVYGALDGIMKMALWTAEALNKVKLTSDETLNQIRSQSELMSKTFKGAKNDFTNAHTELADAVNSVLTPMDTLLAKWEKIVKLPKASTGGNTKTGGGGLVPASSSGNTKTGGGGLVPASSSGNTEDKKVKSESRDFMAEANKEYEDALNAQGAFHTRSKAEDLAFWNDKLAQALAGGEKYKETYNQIYLKVSQIKRESEREILKNKIDALKFESDLDKTNLDTKVTKYKAIFNEIANVYDKDTQEYRQALLNKTNAEKEAKDKKIDLKLKELKQVQDLKLVQFQRELSDIELFAELGYLTEQQKLEKLKIVEEAKYLLLRQYKNQEAQLNKDNVEKYDQVLKEIELLQQQHNLKMKQFSDAMFKDSFAPFKSMGDNLASSFEDALLRMTQGTLSFQGFVKGIIPAIGAEFTKMGVKMVADWVKQHIIMEGMSKVFAMKEIALKWLVENSKLAATLFGTTATVSAKGAEATAVVSANAAEAGSGAAAAVAPIPIVGPAMAAAAFVGVMAMVLGATKLIKSASGGFDIPSGVNPMTQLHQEEMVLPASIANPLRENLAGGGGMGGATTINISAVDAKGVKDLFMSHGGALVDALKKQNRQFAR